MFPLYKLRLVPYDCNDLKNAALMSRAADGAAVGR
jgi:hypothetical protein